MSNTATLLPGRDEGGAQRCGTDGSRNPSGDQASGRHAALLRTHASTGANNFGLAARRLIPAKAFRMGARGASGPAGRPAAAGPPRRSEPGRPRRAPARPRRARDGLAAAPCRSGDHRRAAGHRFQHHHSPSPRGWRRAPGHRPHRISFASSPCGRAPSRCTRSATPSRSASAARALRSGPSPAINEAGPRQLGQGGDRVMMRLPLDQMPNREDDRSREGQVPRAQRRRDQSAARSRRDRRRVAQHRDFPRCRPQGDQPGSEPALTAISASASRTARRSAGAEARKRGSWLASEPRAVITTGSPASRASHTAATPSG